MVFSIQLAPLTSAQSVEVDDEEDLVDLVTPGFDLVGEEVLGEPVVAGSKVDLEGGLHA